MKRKVIGVDGNIVLTPRHYSITFRKNHFCTSTIRDCVTPRPLKKRNAKCHSYCIKYLLKLFKIMLHVKLCSFIGHLFLKYCSLMKLLPTSVYPSIPCFLPLFLSFILPYFSFFYVLMVAHAITGSREGYIVLHNCRQKRFLKLLLFMPSFAPDIVYVKWV